MATCIATLPPPSSNLQRCPRKPTNANGTTIHSSTPQSANLRRSQNNALLESLSGKVSALRGVTVDIYDNARNHDLIDSNADAFNSFGTNLRNSAGRLTRMAQSGNKIAILKLSGIIIGVILVLYFIARFFF